MAKLLRITTEENDGSFDNSLDAGFTLPSNSTVALQSANFTFETGQINMDASNERFELSIANVNRSIIIRDHHDFFDNDAVEYNSSNFNEFLKNMEASINREIYQNATDDNEAGYEVRVAVNQNHKVQLDMQRGRFVDWGQSPLAFQFDRFNLGVDAANNHCFSRVDQDATTAADPGFCVDRMEWCRGGSFARCRVRNLAAGAGNNGFIFGVITEEQLVEYQGGNPIFTADFCFAVRLTGPGDNIKAVTSLRDGGGAELLDVEATPGGAAIVPSLITGGGHGNHDAFTITVDQGRFTLEQFTQAIPQGRVLQPIHPLGQDEDDYGIYNPNIRYYVALMIEGQDDKSTQIDLVGSINSPFGKRVDQPTAANLVFSQQLAKGVMNVAAVPDIPNQNSVVQIALRFTEGGSLTQVDNTELMAFLGYTNALLNGVQPQAQDAYSFIAQKTSISFVKSQTFVVQLVSLPVESYDSVSGKKENTIYTIVENTFVNVAQEVSFNSQFPIYIALKNKNPILLRRLRARIVDHNLEPLLFRGQSQLTLLFGE